MSFQIPNALNLVEIVPTTLPVYSGASDWVSITGAVTNEVLFLVNDATNGKYTIRTNFTRPASQNIYIDWGDGSPVDTISSTGDVDTVHQYTSGGTPSSRGYNTWKIRIYGDAGTRITVARFIQNSTDFVNYPCGLIQAWFGDNTVTTLANNFNQNATSPQPPVFYYLEYVRMPEGMTASTALFQTFNACRVLQKVDLPTSLSFLGGQALQNTFYDCQSLIEVSDFPADMTGITSLSQTFYQCFALPKIVFRGSSLPLVTTAVRFVQNCTSLGFVNLPALPLCTDWGLAFSNCYNLRSMSIPIIPNTTVSTLQTFSNCVRLQTVFFDPNTTATMSFQQFFQGCTSLRSFRFPLGLNVTSLQQAFSTCSVITDIILPNSLANCTSFVSAFAGAQMLTSLTLPNTAPTGTYSWTTIFSSCRNLTELTIPNTYTGITSLQQAFLNSGISNITLPSSLPSCTDLLGMATGCFYLQSVTLPTTMNAVTTLSATFQNCYNLRSITMPTSMNGVTTIANCFQNCYALQQLTMPTSMTGLGGSGSNLALTNAFQSCTALQEIIFPATINGSTANLSALNCLNGCINLKRVVLPTSGMNVQFNNATSMFNNCYALTGITNLEYFGVSGSSTTVYMNGTTFTTGSREITSLDFNCKFSVLNLNGSGTGTNLSKLSSLRLRNSGSGQYGGASPQINISFTNLSQAALVQVFNDLPTITAKTINITSATGAAALTAGERAIATGKGWTIVG